MLELNTGDIRLLSDKLIHMENIYWFHNLCIIKKNNSQGFEHSTVRGVLKQDRGKHFIISW